VTAEVAVAMPAVVLLLGMCVAVVQLAAQAVALQGAVGDAARLAARGADHGIVVSRIHEVDREAEAVVEVDGEFACVRATAPSRMLGASFGRPLEARACALDDRAAPW